MELARGLCSMEFLFVSYLLCVGHLTLHQAWRAPIGTVGITTAFMYAFLSLTAFILNLLCHILPSFALSCGGVIVK
jgi:hypothetical protein